MLVFYRNVLIAFLAAVFAALPFSATAQQPPALPVIHVGIIPVEAAAEAYFANDEGFFKKQGIDVDLQVMQNGGAIAAAVAGGSLDIGFADVISVANARAHDIPFVFLAPAIRNSYIKPAIGLVVNGAGPIHEAKDLNNKTIAVNGLNNITMVPFEVWIDKSGGDSKSIKWIEVPIPAADDAIASGRVDAGTLGEPFVTLGQDRGLRVLYVDKNGISPSYAMAGYIATKDWTAKNSVLAVKFANAIKEAGAWANASANRDASTESLSKFTKIPLPVVQRMKRSEFTLTLLPAEFQPVIDAAFKYGAIPKAYSAADLFFTPAK
jgi:NitT/TauT family transport system substrate-binding protein